MGCLTSKSQENNENNLVMEEKQYEVTLRFMIVGDNQVGIASLAYRFLENKFLENQEQNFPFEQFSIDWEETRFFLYFIKKKENLI